MNVYPVYKYQKDWELTPFSFLIGAAFAGGSLTLLYSFPAFFMDLPQQPFSGISQPFPGFSKGYRLASFGV